MIGAAAFAIYISATVAQPGFEFFEAGSGGGPFDVMVHRGRKDLAPENTAPAIEACVERGYGWIEIDVRLTRDGQHVVFHDSEVDGKSDGHGAIADLTMDEIKAFDAGSYFSEDYAGERILSLPECFRLCKGRINIYLDCKHVSPALLVREILEESMENQVVVFDDLDVLSEIKSLSRGNVPIMPKWHPEFGIDDWVTRVQPSAVEINAEEVTREICKRFRDLGIIVQAKVLGKNDRPEVWRKMLECGVVWFQTDRPDEVIDECTSAISDSQL